MLSHITCRRIKLNHNALFERSQIQDNELSTILVCALFRIVLLFSVWSVPDLEDDSYL